MDLAVLGASHVSRSGEDPTSNPTDLGATSITNRALLLLFLVLLPGFFELLTQLEVLLGQECLAGCLAA
jgi:hypothetical protein